VKNKIAEEQNVTGGRYPHVFDRNRT